MRQGEVTYAATRALLAGLAIAALAAGAAVAGDDDAPKGRAQELLRAPAGAPKATLEAAKPGSTLRLKEGQDARVDGNKIEVVERQGPAGGAGIPTVKGSYQCTCSGGKGNQTNCRVNKSVDTLECDKAETNACSGTCELQVYIPSPGRAPQ